MLLRRLTAPTRHVRHPEKGQCHRRGQFFPTVQSVACSELLTVRERDRPEENASCCDPDKDATEWQVGESKSELSRLRTSYSESFRERAASQGRQRLESSARHTDKKKRRESPPAAR